MATAGMIVCLCCCKLVSFTSHWSHPRETVAKRHYVATERRHEILRRLHDSADQSRRRDIKNTILWQLPSDWGKWHAIFMDWRQRSKQCVAIVGRWWRDNVRYSLHHSRYLQQRYNTCNKQKENTMTACARVTCKNTEETMVKEKI